MQPKRIYQINSKAEIKLNNTPAIAFCAIGQPVQFFDFAKKYYDIKECIAFSDHYMYQKKDIYALIKIAEKYGVNTFITTQKDEAKLVELTKMLSKYSFNVLELKVEINPI